MRTTRLTGINRSGVGSKRVSKVKPADFARAIDKKDRSDRDHEPINVIAPGHQQTLTIVDNIQSQRCPAGVRLAPSAPLIAQLIATHLELPQTRSRRRASSDVASGQYVNGVSKEKSEMIGTYCFKIA